METLKISELQPSLRTLLLHQLNIDVSDPQGIIVYQPLKNDYEVGSKEHLQFLLEHRPSSLGVMFTDMTHERYFGTLNDSRKDPERINSHGNSSNTCIGIFREWTRTDKFFPNLRDAIEALPFKLIDDCISEPEYDSADLAFKISIPYTLTGRFDVSDDVIESYYEDEIAMNLLEVVITANLYLIDSREEMFWEVSKEEFKIWLDSDELNAKNRDVQMFAYALNIKTHLSKKNMKKPALPPLPSPSADDDDDDE